MDIVLGIHSLVRFAILFFAFAGIIKTGANLVRRAVPAQVDGALASAFLGSYDLQVLIGLLIILLGGLNQALHPILMFIGVLIAHVLQTMTKRNLSLEGNWLRLVFYALPLLVILAGLATISRLPY